MSSKDIFLNDIGIEAKFGVDTIIEDCKPDAYIIDEDQIVPDDVDIEVFKDIVAIASEDNLVAGITSKGAVIATDDNTFGQCEVDSWKDIVDISVNDNNTFGLKADGTVVVAGRLKDDKRFSSLNGIVDISVGYSHFLGIKMDGTVISIGIVGSGAEYNVQDWDLY